MNNIPTTIEYRESTSKFHSTSCTSSIACFEVNWSRISTQTVVSLVTCHAKEGVRFSRADINAFLHLSLSLSPSIGFIAFNARKKGRSKEEAIEMGKGRGYKGEVGGGQREMGSRTKRNARADRGMRRNARVSSE